MRVLVTRPSGQAAATTARLRELGHAPLLHPLLGILPLPGGPPPQDFDALVVTSANAVPALASGPERLRACPAFAVGAATARALAATGFGSVTAGTGDGRALALQLAAALPRARELLHVAGRDRRPEPARSLREAGFSVAVWEVYAAEPASALPAELAASLRAGTVDAVLHYSRRSAETLVRLAAAAELAPALRATAHLCLSAEVAEALAGLAPPRLVVCGEPTEASLLGALDQVGRNGGLAPGAAPVLDT